MVSCNVSCWAQLVSVFLRDVEFSDGDLQTVLLGGLKREMSKACIDRSDSLIFQHKRCPCAIGFIYASSEVHFRSTESQTFYRSDADDSIKCRSELRHDRLSGWFLKSRGLSANVSFLSSPPLPALLIAQFFAWSLTLVPRSLLRNSTETLATQAT